MICCFLVFNTLSLQNFKRGVAELSSVSLFLVYNDVLIYSTISHFLAALTVINGVV